MNPISNPSRCPWLRPFVNECIWITALAVVCESRRYEPRFVSPLAEIWMVGKQDAQETASGVLPGLAKAGADLPVHMPSLPGAETNQHNRDRRISDVSVADLLTNSCCLQSGVVYVSCVNRSVQDALSHHTDKAFLVLDVVLMEADEHLVFGSFSGHTSAPNYKTKRHASRTVTVTAA